MIHDVQNPLPDVFPVNTPILIVGNENEAAALGAGGSLPSAMGSICKQCALQMVEMREVLR